MTASSMECVGNTDVSHSCWLGRVKEGPHTGWDWEMRAGFPGKGSGGDDGCFRWGELWFDGWSQGNMWYSQGTVKSYVFAVKLEGAVGGRREQ